MSSLTGLLHVDIPHPFAFCLPACFSRAWNIKPCNIIQRPEGGTGDEIYYASMLRKQTTLQARDGRAGVVKNVEAAQGRVCIKLKVNNPCRKHDNIHAHANSLDPIICAHAAQSAKEQG